MASPARTRTSTHQTKRVTDSFENALSLFHETSQRVPAYKDFLRKAKIRPDRIKTLSDFAHIPPTDKQNYILTYDLQDLSWDGTLDGTKYISSSSGSTGTPLYWPRGDVQGDAAGRISQRVYENIFDTKHGTTLCINLFGLGTWIAGLEFYNAAKYVADHGNRISIATPGIEKEVAIDTIKRLAPSFDRIVLMGYPPFIKDVLETCAAEGIEWPTYDVRLLTGGESFSERWRDRVLTLIGKPHSLTHVINAYGMAESGIIGHETPLSLLARRASPSIPTLAERFAYEGTTAALYQYDPRLRYFEVGHNDTLILTTRAGLPLVRYNTRDQGGIIAHGDMATHLASLSVPAPNLLRATPWRLPFVYLYGRRDLSISFYALNIYVENVKYAFETCAASHQLSGLFVMQIEHTRDLDQRFTITAELGREAQPHPTLTREVTTHLVRALRSVNTEYAKLHASIGQRAVPKVRMVRYGEIDTFPGRKHRWIKRV